MDFMHICTLKDVCRPDFGREMAGVLQKAMEAKGNVPSRQEWRSWISSLQALADLLAETGLDEKILAGFEGQLPLSGKRADVVLASRRCLLVLELKQWRSAEPADGERPDLVRTWTGGDRRDVLHPAVQTAAYVRELAEWNREVRMLELEVTGAVWLHNMSRRSGQALLERQESGEPPLFFRENREMLKTWLQTMLSEPPAPDLLWRISQSPLRPAPLLQDALRHSRKRTICLQGAQQRVFSGILEAAKCSSGRIHVVQGGPGTGKTVVALQLLMRLLEQGRSGLYTSGCAPARRNLIGSIKEAGELPRGFTDTLIPLTRILAPGCSQAEVILVDDAQRLSRKHKGIAVPDRSLPPALAALQRSDSLDQLLHASGDLVLFLDETQQVSADDACTLQDIRQAVRDHNRTHPGNPKDLIGHPVLQEQQRMRQGQAALRFVSGLLDRKGAAEDSLDAQESGFRVMATPRAVVRALEKKQAQGDSVRLCGGRCWPAAGQKEEPGGCGFHIGSGFFGYWPQEADQKTMPEGYLRVDSVQDIQGQEADWTGVLIGPDLVFRQGNVQTVWHKRTPQDWLMGGLQQQLHPGPAECQVADRIIRDTYRVLLTRAREGCFVWCADKELKAYLQELSGGG